MGNHLLQIEDLTKYIKFSLLEKKCHLEAKGKNVNTFFRGPQSMFENGGARFWYGSRKCEGGGGGRGLRENNTAGKTWGLPSAPHPICCHKLTPFIQ